MTDADTAQRNAFAAVGRDLLSYELEAVGGDVYRECNRASRKIRDGDRITEQDVRQFADVINRADMLVDAFYDACPEAERPPKTDDMLTVGELLEITERNAVEGESA